MKVSEAQKKQIVDYLKEQFSPYFIILFGSGQKGTMRKDSDIDIAFLADKDITDYESFMAAQELADALGKDVDLVNLKKASTVFKAQIIGTGEIIYDREPQKRMEFQMKSLKEYALLNEERQCIFDKINERGSVYD